MAINADDETRPSTNLLPDFIGNITRCPTPIKSDALENRFTYAFSYEKTYVPRSSRLENAAAFSERPWKEQRNPQGRAPFDRPLTRLGYPSS